MLLPLTTRQREVLDFVRQFMARAGYPQTVREIGAHFGFVPRSIFDHLKALERKGYLRRDGAKSRSLQILEPGSPSSPPSAIRHPPSYRELPILGRVAAGQPLLSDQNLEGTSVVPGDWVNGDEAFLLKVQGDSMIGAHICDGDLALIRPQVTAENGEIVVALIDGEATLKRFYRERDGRIRLQAENSGFAPLVIAAGEAETVVIGKLLRTVRSYE